MSDFNIDSREFQSSPLNYVYNSMMENLKRRDGKRRASHHRVSLTVAWAAHITPKITSNGHKVASLHDLAGLPSSKRDLAKVLGVSERAVYRYLLNYSKEVEYFRSTGVDRLLGGYKLSAVLALAQSASNPDPRHSADRRTLLTITGDLVDKSETELSTKDGQTAIAILNVDVEKLK